MKLKVDENLPIEVAEALQQAGHDAVTVHDQRLTGRPEALLTWWWVRRDCRSGAGV
jgi:hypothetical protein